MDNTWDELLEFETRDLVTRYFKSVHGSNVNSWKVQEVTSNFIQSREYFKNAENAGITVKPLLLYYGVLSLTRGLILTLNPKLTERTLKPSHGIDIVNWEEILKTKKFEDLKLKVGNGTFSELIHSTRNINYLRAATNVINWKTKLSIPENNYSISLKELYYYLPDLNKEFKLWTNEEISYARLLELKFDTESNKSLVKIRKTKHGISAEILDKLFPKKFCPNRTTKEDGGSVTISYDNSNWGPNFSQRWTGSMFDIGDACIVPVLEGDKGFNLLSTMYALSYVYGMMARYFPSSWISLGRTESGDRIYPLIHKTLDYIKERYPIAILSFLRAPYPFEKNEQNS